MIAEKSTALVFPPFEDQVPSWEPGEGRLPEIHLYFGSRCNRECDFCVVFGSPRGWMAEVDEELLEALLDLLHPQAQLKIYGGEPTLLAANLRWVFAELRQRGFAGRFTLFSNGIQSARLLELLEADDNSCCVLNYSILTGTHAEPLPSAALRQLTEYARRHPGRLFAGHPDLVEVGRAQQWGREQLRQRTDFDHACPRCFPVATTRGRYHACPFAVENNSPHYDLGDLHTPPQEVERRYGIFLDWLDEVLVPQAQSRGCHPCTLCTQAAGQLPLPKYGQETIAAFLPQ
ncbi:MAG: 4Fe-4S cluster-binding domain-containing protein [Candidatus Latescibacteria bacterium]|nr:4Fe-4S cluster-binding domain-containing protein [Candidatus Latescibacterota bacterium]